MFQWEAMTLLTLFDHLSQHPGQFQHDWRPAAWVDGTVHPAVPVVPIDHIPVCGHTHTQNSHRLGKQMTSCGRFRSGHRSHLARRSLWSLPSHWRSSSPLHSWRCPVSRHWIRGSASEVQRDRDTAAAAPLRCICHFTSYSQRSKRLHSLIKAANGQMDQVCSAAIVDAFQEPGSCLLLHSLRTQVHR